MIKIGMLLDFGELLPERVFSDFLNPAIDRGVDDKASFRDCLEADQFNDLLPYLFIHKSRLPGNIPLRNRLHGDLLHPGPRVGIDMTFGLHSNKDVIPPFDGSFWKTAR